MKSHHIYKFSPLSFAINSIDSECVNNPNNNDGGSYIDLDSIEITSSSEASILDNLFNETILMSHRNSNNNVRSGSITPTNMNEWRSNHWIVLIDDEPSIRLAIGDYLHSMGYTMITACDGPLSFLDVLLYSCGWSFAADDDSVSRRPTPPPWMKYKMNGEETETSMLWRLPNCIISDIRMPGGVDGVELLQLLRQYHVNDDNDGNRSGSGSAGKDNDNVKKAKKKGRPKKGQEKSNNNNNEYDGKDDFELLDAIVGSSNKDGSSNTGKQRIVTPIYQAGQKLNVIRDTLAYHQELSNNQSNSNSRQQYPTSLLQIPVILLTAKAMVSDRIVGFNAGANNYLPKPFRPEELLGMVDSLLRKQERERKEWMDDVGGASSSDVVEEEVKYVDELEMYSASAQQIKDLTRELIEIKKLLKEEAQREINVKVEQEEIERLTKLLPNALWMFMNNERRKRLFTSDHIRSILLFCFDDVSLARKSTAKRDELLTELERVNDENPDVLSNFLVSG